MTEGGAVGKSQEGTRCERHVSSMHKFIERCPWIEWLLKKKYLNAYYKIKHALHDDIYPTVCWETKTLLFPPNSTCECL